MSWALVTVFMVAGSLFTISGALGHAVTIRKPWGAIPLSSSETLAVGILALAFAAGMLRVARKKTE